MIQMMLYNSYVTLALSIFILVTFVLGIAGRVVALIMLLLAVMGLGLSWLPWLICLVILLHLGTGQLSLWTEDKLLLRFLKRDHAASKEPPRHLVREWKAPMKLNKLLKVLIGLASICILIAPLLPTALFLWQMGAASASNSTPDAVFSSSFKPFNTLFFLQWPIGLLQLGLSAFYLIHTIKNTTAAKATRIILGVGLFTLPALAIPVYYYLYIWPDQPPAWAIEPETPKTNSPAGSEPAGEQGTPT